ncbi:arabinose operon regulatory protein [Abditibacteriota bacterium]|nr:arabinose operon regulatory protein [Abditibacteriota bacterium]
MQSAIARWIAEVEVSDWDAHKRENATFFVHRPGGSGDWLFLHFRTPIVVRGFGELSTGTCLVFSPRSPQWYKGPQKQGFINDYVHFRAPAFPFWPQDSPFAVADGDSISRGLGAMAREITHREANWRCGAALQLALLFVELSRQHPAASDRSAPRTDERLTTLRAEIYARPQDKWTLALMSRRVHLSASRLSAVYKEGFGVSPLEDVLAARTQKARTLLLNRGISIESVARECGFESAAYFSRQFKLREGSAPRDWARRWLEI